MAFSETIGAFFAKNFFARPNTFLLILDLSTALKRDNIHNIIELSLVLITFFAFEEVCPCSPGQVRLPTNAKLCTKSKPKKSCYKYCFAMCKYHPVFDLIASLPYC